MRLPLSDRCPMRGTWLAKEQFYYQHPKVFAQIYAQGKRGFDEPWLKLEESPFKDFGHHPLCIEFCSGNGEWIEQKARKSPECRWIAVEQRLDRAHKIWFKKERGGLRNLLIACAEASLFCHMHLSDQSVSQCFVNFPDPWPKKKHAKHRLLNLHFMQQIESILKPQGHLFVASDDANTTERLQEILIMMKGFEHYTECFLPNQSFQHYGGSYFESLWRSKGKNIYLTHCIKIGRQEL